MADKNYSNILLKLSREYTGTKYEPLVDEAVQAYVNEDYTKIDEVISKLPDDIQLLEILVNKLQGKSVHTNISKLLEGKDQSTEQAAISTSSLITHCVIECKENKEFKRLLPDLYKKLGILIQKI